MDKNVADCPICLNPLALKDQQSMCACMHRFHTQCIQAWTARNATCPVCRTPCSDLIPVKFAPPSNQGPKPRGEAGTIDNPIDLTPDVVVDLTSLRKNKARKLSKRKRNTKNTKNAKNTKNTKRNTKNIKPSSKPRRQSRTNRTTNKKVKPQARRRSDKRPQTSRSKPHSKKQLKHVCRGGKCRLLV